LIIWLAFADLLKVLWYIFLFDIKNGQFFSFVFGGPFKSGGILAKHKMWWKNCYHVCKVHALIFRLKRENDGWIFLDEWKKTHSLCCILAAFSTLPCFLLALQGILELAYMSGKIFVRHHLMWWKNSYNCKVNALIFWLMKKGNHGWKFVQMKWKKLPIHQCLWN